MHCPGLDIVGPTAQACHFLCHGILGAAFDQFNLVSLSLSDIQRSRQQIALVLELDDFDGSDQIAIFTGFVVILYFQVVYLAVFFQQLSHQHTIIGISPDTQFQNRIAHHLFARETH